MSHGTKLGIVLVLALAVAGAIVLKQRRTDAAGGSTASAPGNTAAADVTDGLPRLVDLGSTECIPCKMMAPILDELAETYAGRLQVDFIDVFEDPDATEQYDIRLIPTQIFYDPTGQELFRHEGFFGKEDILARWQELGFDLAGRGPALAREEPLEPDTRPRDGICSLCGGDVPAISRTVVQGQSERRILCSPHCYFIYFSSIVDADPDVEDAKVSVTDASTGQRIAATTATYLRAVDARGRPTVRAFAGEEAARTAARAGSGNLLAWGALRASELSTRCGFCDRAVYPEDAAAVEVGGRHAWGCCPMCALGVAARTGENVVCEVADALSGKPIRVTTFDGSLATMDPPTAVAWAGRRRNADGQMVSAGCFAQAWFVNAENLAAWLDAHPTATGRQITIAAALAAKMSMTEEQIAGACKLGACQ